jgi:hypothetical protein
MNMSEQRDSGTPSTIYEVKDAGTFTITVPKHRCGTHGDHEWWICMKREDAGPWIRYCQLCIMDFMDRQSIGRVTEPDPHAGDKFAPVAR